MAEENESFDPSLKKKKKKKKTPFDLDGALNDGGADEAAQEDAPEPSKDDADDIDLESFGKKKKKKKKLEDDAEEKGDEEKDVPKEDLDDLDLESFGEKKKKKKKKPALNMKELEEALPDDEAEAEGEVDLESFGTKKEEEKEGQD